MHQCREHDWGMVYSAMLNLIQAEKVKTEVDGKEIEFVKAPNGMVGVHGWDQLGTSVRIVIGKMSNTRHDDSSNPRTWPGKLHTDILVICMMTCGNVTFGSDTGFINIHRENIMPAAKHLLLCLTENAYQMHCLPTPVSTLQKTPGWWIQLRMCEMAILLQGFTNQSDYKLIDYEDCPCFIDTKLRFLRTHYLRLCDCVTDCQLKNHITLVYCLVIDIIKMMRKHYKAKITLENIFSRKNVLDFISKMTVKVGFERFRIRDTVPRIFETTHASAVMTMQGYLNDDILHKNEALVEKAAKPWRPLPDTHVWPEDTSLIRYDEDDLGTYLARNLPVVFGEPKKSEVIGYRSEVDSGKLVLRK